MGRTFDEVLMRRRTVYRVIKENEPIRYTDIMRKTIGDCGSGGAQGALTWLFKRGYIERISRGVYRTTDKQFYLPSSG